MPYMDIGLYQLAQRRLLQVPENQHAQDEGKETNHDGFSQQRAAQFAPFAALSGYEDAIEETARHTEARPVLSEDIKEIIEYKLRIISEYSEDEASADITYFVPDEKKDGGRYESASGKVKKIDKEGGCVIMENKVKIPIKDIIDISGDLFDYLDIGL